jgi:gas vesicle protein
MVEDNKGLSYFFLGVGVGVAVGLLFAPKSGEETRGLIKGKVGEGGDFIKQRGQEIKDQASTYVDKGKDLVTRQKEQIAAAVEAGKQAYRETVGGPFDRTPGSENNF